MELIGAMKSLNVLGLLIAAIPAHAAPKPAESHEPRISTLVVFGTDPCPQSSDEEIIVCARQPESERYRIPEQFRNKRPEEPGLSWATRVRTLDMVSRRGIPNSCSPIGSNGQTGCLRQFLEAARAEREAAKRGE